MKAKSIKGKSAEEIKQSITMSLNDGFTPTLAIVFLSKNQEYDVISEFLDQKGIAVFGASTNGEFIDEDLL